ncbi:FlgD immunoglobulin-like domain containing protein [candidate division KSB1 bacterium]
MVEVPTLFKDVSAGHRYILIAALLLTVSGSAGAYTPPPGSPLASGEHPRIYFTDNYLDDMTAKVDSAFQDSYLALRGRAATVVNETIDHGHRREYAILLSFMAVMEKALGTGNVSYASKAFDYADYLGKRTVLDDDWELRHQIGQNCLVLALAYDWLYNDLDSSERAILAGHIVKWIDAGLYYLPHHTHFHNMTTLIGHGMVTAALAVYGDPSLSDGGAAYLDMAYDLLFNEQIAGVNDAGKNGGGWHEGWAYGWEGAIGPLPAEMQAWYSATGQDPFTACPALGELARHFIYIRRPYNGRIAHLDRNFAYGNLDDTRLDNRRTFFSLLAARYSDGLAQYLAELEPFPSEYSLDTIYDIIWYDPTIEAVDPALTDLPEAVHFEGQGLVVIRSGFDSPYNTFFLFRARDYYGGNTSFGEGHFALHKGAGLALRSGQYDGWSSTSNQNYYMKTIAYNSILVYDPDEVITRGQTRDGGQIYGGQDRNIADIRFEATTEYVFAEGDITRAYSSNKVSLLKRRAIRLTEPDIYLMLDRVSVTNKYFLKKWVMHSTNRPVVAEPGTVLVVERQTGETINIASYRGDLTKVMTGGSALYVKTLLPEQHQVRLVGGAGYEFWVDDPGANYPLDNRNETAEPGSWRMEVIPEGDWSSAVFLNILYPTVNTDETPPEGQLLEEDGTIGAQIGDWVVHFSQEGGGAALDSLGYSVQHSGKLNHLITDFRWGGVIVLQDSIEIARAPVSPEGNIYFESSGGGDFLITIDPASAAPGPDEKETKGAIPKNFALFNYPNPFNPATTLAFRVGLESEVELAVYNIMGRKVRTLEKGTYSPGTYRIGWDGRDDRGGELPSGIYISSLIARDPDSLRQLTRLTRKMTLMR